MNAFMGTVGVLPDKPELDKWLKREQALADAGGAVLTPQPVDALPADLCGVNGTAKDECMRTIPPRENGGNTDTKETVVDTRCRSLASLTAVGSLPVMSTLPWAAARWPVRPPRWAPR